MITYELAKELKEKGFPQKGRDWYKSETDIMNWGYSVVTPEGIYIPTLSELIEACGEDFMDIRHKRFGDFYMDLEKEELVEIPPWYASSINKNLGGGIHSCGGSTPEEAVARLWIELNSK